MKRDLIDKNALVEALLDYTWRDDEGFLIESTDEKRRFIKRWLPDVPTVEAIPIEWIKEWVNNYCDRNQEQLIECLLRTWNKKNERGEK